MENVKIILNQRKNAADNNITVNSNNKNNKSTVNSNTVNSRIDEILEELKYRPQAVAERLAQELDDLKSLDYYNILCKESDLKRIFEALSFVKDADSRGKIRTTKPIYFIAILRNWKIRTKFRSGSKGKEET